MTAHTSLWGVPARLPRLSLVVLLAFAAISPGPSAAPAAAADTSDAVYVVNNADGNVSQYGTGAGGELSPLVPPTVDAGADPSLMAVSPDGRSAYVADREAAAIRQYDIDSTTGGLSPKTPLLVPVGVNPGAITIAPDGKSAYVGLTSSDGALAQFDISPVNGTLSPKTPATVGAGAYPGIIAVTPDSSSVYVTSITAFGGGVSQYDVDPQTGGLSPKDPPSVSANFCQRVCRSFTPVSVAVSADGLSAYVLDGGNLGIAQFNIDALTGKLSPKFPPPVETGDPPEYVDTGIVPLSIVVSPDGRSAYVDNREDDTFSQYDIDPASGVLSPKTPPTISAPHYPYYFTVSADSRSLYATHFYDNFVSQYDIDATDGTLSPKSTPTIATGVRPVSIATRPTHKVPTNVDVSCAPNPGAAGAWIECTTTVTDTTLTNPTTPSGTVQFVIGVGGTFQNNRSTCTLSGTGATASCSVMYGPNTYDERPVVGRYGGDGTHVAGRGSTQFFATRLTSTAVDCSPSNVRVGETTTCTVGVTDISDTNVPPVGTVTFTSDTAGTFGNGGACALVDNGATTGTRPTTGCEVAYTPTAFGSGTHTIVASYQGSNAHAPSDSASSGNNAFVNLPPDVTSVSPADGATGVARTTAVLAAFNKPMNKPATEGAFTLRRTSDASPVAGAFSWFGNALVFVPNAALANGTNYTVTVSTAAVDNAGNPIPGAKVSRFTTATQPVITSVSPANGATGVPPNTVVLTAFDTTMDKVSAQSAFSLRRTSNGAAVNGTFSWYGAAMVFKPNVDLGSGIAYTATESSAAKDSAGHALPGAKTWRFTTTIQPIIDSVSPANAATGVSRLTSVVVAFSKAMNKSSAQTAFTLKRTNPTAVVNGTFSWNGNTMIFKPSSSLSANTQYTAIETAAAKDATGHALLNPQTWHFTTRS